MSLFNHKQKSTGVLSNAKIFAIGISLFSLTLATFVTSTVAWFSVSDKLIASNIAINFDNNEDFSLGLRKNPTDEITYNNDWNNQSLEAYSNYVPGEKLGPVSSMFESSWLNESTDKDSAKPVLYSPYENSGSTEHGSVATTGFYQFEFFFHSTRDTYVFLDESTSVVANEDQNAVTAKALGVSEEGLNNVVHAVRVSFYTPDGFTIYEPNATTSSNVAYAGRLDLQNKDGCYDYDSSNKEILYGEYNRDSANLIYDKAVDTEETHKASGNSFEGVTKRGVQALNLDKSISDGGLVIAHEKTYTLSELSEMDINAHPLLYIPAKVDQRMIVTIYIEGWDLDVIDSIGSAEFNLNLAFKGYYMSKE